MVYEAALELHSQAKNLIRDYSLISVFPYFDRAQLSVMEDAWRKEVLIYTSNIIQLMIQQKMDEEMVVEKLKDFIRSLQ